MLPQSSLHKYALEREKWSTGVDRPSTENHGDPAPPYVTESSPESRTGSHAKEPVHPMDAQERIAEARRLLSIFEQQVEDDFTHNESAHRQVARYRRLLRELEVELDN